MRKVALAVVGFFGLMLAEDWTRFRGANGAGLSEAAGYPNEFGKQKNLVWRTPVRPGKSSPILSAKHIFLTSYENGKLYTECFDRETGARLWERSVDRGHDVPGNTLNHPAAISPVTDGENVYAFFKDYGMVSYDARGRRRWTAPLGPFVTTMGLGASPVLSGENVILVADQLQDSYIAAFDRKNGELRWKTVREEGEAWGTPLVYQPAGKPPTIVTISRGQMGTYENRTGKRTSTLRGVATTIVASPILIGDTIYVFGYGSEEPAPFSRTLSRFDKNKDGQITADEYGDEAFVRGIGKYVGNKDGIVTEDEWNLKQKEVLGPNSLMALQLVPGTGEAPGVRELWRYERGFNGVIPSPLFYKDVVYVIKNGGILTSFDAKTGKIIKTGRVQGALSGFSSSPVAADGKIYVAGEDGKVAVLRAGGEWELLSLNDLDEPCFATPALADGHIFLRTDAALYRFGVKR